MALLSVSVSAQKDKYVYTEASEMTLVGKLMPGKTANPYHRADTALYKGFTRRENHMVRMSSGMGCVFKTDSRSISILTEYGQMDDPTNTNVISARGYDLYIRKDGTWHWAGSGVSPRKDMCRPITIVDKMDGSEHECLLYFPTYTEVKSIKIGVEKGAELQPIENPFSHRIAIWGSSYTHGSSTTRAGMTYPAQFSRMTGLQLLSLGCSGRCLLQDYYCDVLVDVEADAFIFDTFSNPRADMIRERLVPFIDRMIEAHPGKPMIFQQTIYRERRNFDCATEAYESKKQEVAARLMKEACKKYENVYFIQTNATDKLHETSVDGTHPSDYGYTLWAKSIQKPLLKIFRKYGIK